jgi:hypothetical protein
MNSIRAMLIALLMISADASAATIRCDNCTETTYQSKSVSAGIGVHHVYDLLKAESRKYQVGLECDENLNDGRTTCVKTASPLAVEPEVTNLTLELGAYYQVTGGTMKSWFTVVADDDSVRNLTAFDVAGPGGPRTQLLNWFSNVQVLSLQNALPSIGSVTHQLTVTIASMWNDSMGQTLVTVQFPEGSEITLSWEVVNNTVAVVEGSAKDKYGNIIPASAEDLRGLRFDYTREGPNGLAQRRMQDYLTAIGAAFRGGPVRWVCVQVGGGKWECSSY